MNNDGEEDSYPIYKILLLGDSSVGKSCILLRYCDDTFQDVHLATIGLDFRLKTVNLEENKKVKLQIWDTAGQDRFRAITKNYYRGSNGIILIFDVTDRASFEHIKNWIEQIKEEAQENIIIYLVGNKIDCKETRVVTTEEGKKIAEEFGLKYFETSAKTKENIDSTFLELVKEINSFDPKTNEGNKGTQLSGLKKVRKKCCM